MDESKKEIKPQSIDTIKKDGVTTENQTNAIKKDGVVAEAQTDPTDQTQKVTVPTYLSLINLNVFEDYLRANQKWFKPLPDAQNDAFVVDRSIKILHPLAGWRRHIHSFVYRTLCYMMPRPIPDKQLPAFQQAVDQLKYINGKIDRLSDKFQSKEDSSTRLDRKRVHDFQSVLASIECIKHFFHGSIGHSGEEEKQHPEVLAILQASFELCVSMTRIREATCLVTEPTTSIAPSKDSARQTLYKALTWPISRLGPIHIDTVRTSPNWFSLHPAFYEMYPLSMHGKLAVMQIILLDKTSQSSVTEEELATLSVDMSLLFGKHKRLKRTYHEPFYGLDFGTVALCEVDQAEYRTKPFIPGLTMGLDEAVDRPSYTEGLPFVSFAPGRHYWLHVPNDTWPIVIVRLVGDESVMVHSTLDLSGARMYSDDDDRSMHDDAVVPYTNTASEATVAFSGTISNLSTVMQSAASRSSHSTCDGAGSSSFSGPETTSGTGVSMALSSNTSLDMN